MDKRKKKRGGNEFWQRREARKILTFPPFSSSLASITHSERKKVIMETRCIVKKGKKEGKERKIRGEREREREREISVRLAA